MICDAIDCRQTKQFDHKTDLFLNKLVVSLKQP